MLCATALVSIALIGAGCKKGPDIVGKWNAQAGGGSADFEFKSDNTFTLSAKVAQFQLTQKGDYKLDDKKLVLTTKDIEAPGLPASAIEMAKKSPKFSQPQSIDIKFDTDDQITLSGFPGAPAGSKPLTLTRSK